MITIGTMAKAFHLLPSQVDAAATSFDIMIMEVMTTWEEFQKNPAREGLISTENLQEILKRSR